MDSSGDFDHRKNSANGIEVPKLATPLPSRGHRGGVISMHRALAHFHLGPMNLVIAVFLFVFFTAAWFAFLSKVCEFWQHIFVYGIRVLPLRADLGLAQHHFTSFFHFDIPFLRMETALPSWQAWWLTCAATVVLFAASFLLPSKMIPIVFLLRGMLLVPATALLFFAFLPARFPHTPNSYLEGLVTAEIALISTVPLLFGLTYYIFDFGLLKKAFLTAMTMFHLTLFLPLQVLAQALILQKTVLFMPVLYIVFGMPINILIIVAFYSWGMTWFFRSSQKI